MTSSEAAPERRSLPLQWVAMGLIIVFLGPLPDTDGRITAHDPLADPIGWLFVLVAVGRLALEQRRLLAGTAAACLAISIPTWFPEVVNELADIDASLSWAVQDVPLLVFLTLLCRSLAAAARPVHRKGYIRFSTLSVLFALMALVTPLAYAASGDVRTWIATVGVIGLQVSEIWLVWSLFTHASRSYAAPRPRAVAG